MNNFRLAFATMTLALALPIVGCGDTGTGSTDTDLGTSGGDTEADPQASETPPADVVAAVFHALDAGDTEALEQLIREDYIQHSSMAADGRDGFMAMVDTLAQMEVTPHRMLVDGDLVATHQTYTMPDGARMVAFDVFRVEQGQLAEHWDAMQLEVPVAQSANGHSMTDGVTEVTDLEATEANRAIVTQFLDVVMRGGDFDRVTEFVSTETYIQHNPMAADGIEGMQALMASMGEQGLTMYYTASPLVVAMGNFVLVGSEGVFGPAEIAPFAVFYDLFRLDDGLVVEHWDVIPASPDPDHLPHDNGYF